MPWAFPAARFTDFGFSQELLDVRASVDWAPAAGVAQPEVLEAFVGRETMANQPAGRYLFEDRSHTWGIDIQCSSGKHQEITAPSTKGIYEMGFVKPSKVQAQQGATWIYRGYRVGNLDSFGFSQPVNCLGMREGWGAFPLLGERTAIATVWAKFKAQALLVKVPGDFLSLVGILAESPTMARNYAPRGC